MSYISARVFYCAISIITKTRARVNRKRESYFLTKAGMATLRLDELPCGHDIVKNKKSKYARQNLVYLLFVG